MKGFIVKTASGDVIRFSLYTEAPETSAAFIKTLPFKKKFFHARVSGQEIWTDDGPAVDIIQENASVFTQPGEIVLGPLKPARVKTSNCIGIYYGEGKGLDAANIFGQAFEEDMHKLKELGNRIWKQGEEELLFEQFDL